MMITEIECCPFHTVFAEDLIKYPHGRILYFHYENNCYISEAINVDKIYLYCKEKYHYKSNEPSYFNDRRKVYKLEPFMVYFDIDKYIFIIPLEEQKANNNIIPFGFMRATEKEKISKREENIVLII